MADFRRIMTVFIITLLFTVFVFSLNEAVNESPDYEDYCTRTAYPVKPYNSEKECESIPQPVQEDYDACDGNIMYNYDSNGCPVSWKCELCSVTYDEAHNKYKFWQFIIAAAFGLIAIIVGLWLPIEKNALNEWVGSGFLLGGLVTLFIGTGLYFSDFYKWLRPIVILFELLLVVFIAYRRLKIQKTK